MSMAPLLGVPGKLKTLIDRLTATRAANLDDLDTTVSSRASQTSVNTIDSEVGTILGRVPSTVASQASVNTVDTNVDTLLSRVPVTVSNSAISKSTTVSMVGNGTDYQILSLGATYDIAKSVVTVDSARRVGVGPVGEPEVYKISWSWVSGSQIAVKTSDYNDVAVSLASSRQLRVSVVEFL